MCTCLRLRAENGAIDVGRTMEFGAPLESCGGRRHRGLQGGVGYQARGLLDHVALALVGKDANGELEIDRHDTTAKHLAWGGGIVGALLANAVTKVVTDDVQDVDGALEAAFEQEAA